MILVSIIIFLLMEIFVFIEFGRLWGFWPTAGAIFFTAFFGCLIVRHQGLAVIRKTQREIKLGDAPAQNLIVGACILFAAMLLLIPGFVTDLLGFLLLIPVFQKPAISIIRKKIGGGGIIKGSGYPDTPIIEGVFDNITSENSTELNEKSTLPPQS